MEKVYSLPELPLAPYSDAQALARRLLEYRDFSALRPLLDELDATGETEARKGVLSLCVGVATEYWWDWDGFTRNLCHHLGHLLFSVDGVVAALEKRDWSNSTFINATISTDLLENQ